MNLFGGIYKGKKVLITGNTGFKGTWLTIWLLELGAEVYGISDKIISKPCAKPIIPAYKNNTSVSWKPFSFLQLPVTVNGL